MRGDNGGPNTKSAVSDIWAGVEGKQVAVGHHARRMANLGRYITRPPDPPAGRQVTAQQRGREGIELWHRTLPRTSTRRTKCLRTFREYSRRPAIDAQLIMLSPMLL